MAALQAFGDGSLWSVEDRWTSFEDKSSNFYISQFFLTIAELFKFVGFFAGRVLSKYTRTGPLLLFTGERKADRMKVSKFAATLPS